MRLEEEVEEHEVQRHEDAEHQRFQQQEGDHVLLDPGGHIPGGCDHQRHHEGGEHDEEHRNAVDAHLVLQTQQPGALFDHLEPGVVPVELRQDEERDQEGGTGRDQRQPLGVAVRRRVAAAQEQRQDRRRQGRQEGDDGKQVVHYCAPPLSVIQVMSSASPITMAKA